MMKWVKIILVLMSLLLPASTALCSDTLAVYGDQFYFLVSEPANWKGYTYDADKNSLNAYFCLPGYRWNNSPAVMYIRVMTKAGATVEQSLGADMKDFSLRKASMAFADLEIKDVPYHYAAKEYLIDNMDRDYLCYIDLGQDWPFYVIFVLSGPKDVSPAYLNDFGNLVRSFQWGGKATLQR